MIARRKLNHIAAGLLDKFIGRYNDYEGYWALGYLYAEARASANRVEFDLLAGTARPPSPACASVAGTYAHYLRQASGQHGATLEALSLATIIVEFGMPPIPNLPGQVAYGDPFLCSLRLDTSDGRTVVRQKWQHCMPHDQFHGSRSTRYTG